MIQKGIDVLSSMGYQAQNLTNRGNQKANQ